MYNRRMSTTLSTRKAKNTLFLIKQFLDGIIYSPVNPAIVFSLCIFTYATKLSYIGLFLLSVYFCLLLALYDDITPVIPCAISVCFMFRDLSITNIRNVVFDLLVLADAGFLIYHLIRFRPKKIAVGQLFVPLIAVMLAFFTGGLLSIYIYDYLKGLPFAISLGLGIPALYFVFLNYVNPPASFNLKLFLAQIFMYAGLAIAFEMIVHNILGFTTYNLGWGNINLGATVFLLAVPLTFYLLTKARIILPYVFAILVLYLGAVLSRSDGVLAILLVFSPIMLIYAFKYMRAEKRKLFTYLCAFGIIAVLIVGILAAYLGLTQQLIEKLIKVMTDDNKRSDIYGEAWKLFINNPVFGVGEAYYNDALYEPGSGIIAAFNFHCTPLHILATMGLFGMICYVVYFVMRYRIIGVKNTCFTVFAFLTFSLFECYGFVDPAEFCLAPNMLNATIFITLVELINSVPSNGHLPLFKSTANKVALYPYQWQNLSPLYKKLYML